MMSVSERIVPVIAVIQFLWITWLLIDLHHLRLCLRFEEQAVRHLKQQIEVLEDENKILGQQVQNLQNLQKVERP
jgi:cell division protein FtsB